MIFLKKSHSFKQKNQNDNFNYNKCKFHCQIKRYKTFTSKNFHAYIYENKLILSINAYDKIPYKIIEIKSDEYIQWKIKKNQKTLQTEYLGFKIIKKIPINDYMIEKKEYQFYANNIIIRKIKEHLCKYVWQRKFNDEFEIKQKIGQGNYGFFNFTYRNIIILCSQMLQQIIITLNQKSICINFYFFFNQFIYNIKQIQLQALQKEIQIMRILDNHPHIIQLQGIYDSDQYFYLVMDFIQGNSLLTEIKKNRVIFTQDKIKDFLKQLISVLQYQKKYSIMHRDLKPENIMFQSKEILDNLVVVDYGLAEFEYSNPFLFTKCGTPGYCAPECINDQKTEQKTNCDVFSLGVIFHLLQKLIFFFIQKNNIIFFFFFIKKRLFNKSLFYGKNLNEVLNLNKRCEIQLDFQEVYNNGNKQSLDLLNKMLQKNPNDRILIEDILNHEYFQEKSEQNESNSLAQNQQNSLILNTQEEFASFYISESNLQKNMEENKNIITNKDFGKENLNEKNNKLSICFINQNNDINNNNNNKKDISDNKLNKLRPIKEEDDQGIQQQNNHNEFQFNFVDDDYIQDLQLDNNQQQFEFEQKEDQLLEQEQQEGEQQ
ncbi:protein kinase domain protein [Ichthyophthirius multifiliis]|uniref:Protein kinase domain protein n=1 Tax=Ichthyophthirius multifiliis TaxID=5932 RepID=G0QW88_ICHMU|nr:protein kinase domain protein [Ichthyophthirius multifiliis]EGR30511.1 protein kinase domain protein [Ichthyophthirius multifiliis]|eukprot:XP_004032098.1 protein kinase domain protein [Ichthyophthirius multifiliis]